MKNALPIRIALVLGLALLVVRSDSLSGQEPKKPTFLELGAMSCNPPDANIATLFRMADAMKEELLAGLGGQQYCVSKAAGRILSYALPRESARRLEKWRLSQDEAVAHMPVSIPLGADDFQRLEHSLREYGSGGREAEISRSNLFSAYVFALALDGSPKSRRLLDELGRLTKSVVSIESNVLRGDVELALRAKPRRLMRGKNLEAMLRRNLFFVSGDSVVNSVRLLAMNTRGDRALFGVDTGCGSLCGAGYHVVLEKSGDGWKYALIVSTWLS